MSDLNVRCIDSWRRVMPDYQIKEWNETNSPLDNAYTQMAYDRKLWAKLSNYVRLHALNTEGGIYLDTDVEVIQSFAPLLHHKCFVGFQVEEDQVDWVNNAVLGAQPGHQFLKRGLELTRELFAETGEFYRSPTVTTTTLKEMGLKEYGLQEIKEVTVYPVEYFYPYPWTSKFSPDCIKENTYCIHHWTGSGLEPGHKKMSFPRRVAGRVLRALTRKP